MNPPAPPPAVADRRHRLFFDRRCYAFSLPELLTTIAIIGILAAICMESYSNINSSARANVAADTSALVNRAVLHYSQANTEILDSAAAGTTDELAVLQKLQTRDSDIPGSPYIPSNFSGTTSSSNIDYRLQWNGHAFQVLAPGTAGAGIKVGN
jgi:prepilin-type N-terminal cleavage/methylation domain-containing protein